MESWKKRRLLGMQISRSPAIATVPVIPMNVCLVIAAELLEMPGATVVRLSVAEAPGVTVVEPHVTPPGNEPPQVKTICELKPRMLCVFTVIGAAVATVAFELFKWLTQ